MEQKPKLLERFRRMLIAMGYADSTINDYINLVARFIRFNNLQHPGGLGESEIGEFVTHMGYDLGLSSSSQNKALCALILFYTKILNKSVGKVSNLRWAKKKKRLPNVYSLLDAQKIIQELLPPYSLMACLGFGCGMRISEVLNLRIQDIDFDRKVIRVVQGKHSKDREVPLPEQLVTPLRLLSQQRRSEFIQDMKGTSRSDAVFGRAATFDVAIPSNSGQQVLFVHKKLFVDFERRVLYRKAYSRQAVDKALKKAMRIAGVNRIGGFHSFRHTYSTLVLSMGMNIRELQQYLGHESVTTTQIYTHVTQNFGRNIVSPLNQLDIIES